MFFYFFLLKFFNIDIWELYLKSLGNHFLTELFSCNIEIINNVELVEEYMKISAALSGATIVQSVFHTFSPYGVSGVVILEESHLAVHTWPEHGYVAIDFFSCGDLDCNAAISNLSNRFGAEKTETKKIERGILKNLDRVKKSFI